MTSRLTRRQSYRKRHRDIFNRFWGKKLVTDCAIWTKPSIRLKADDDSKKKSFPTEPMTFFSRNQKARASGTRQKRGMGGASCVSFSRSDQHKAQMPAAVASAHSKRSQKLMAASAGPDAEYERLMSLRQNPKMKRSLNFRWGTSKRTPERVKNEVVEATISNLLGKATGKSLRGLNRFAEPCRGKK